MLAQKLGALIADVGFVVAAEVLCCCLLLLLLRRIRILKGRFRDGQWEKLLLIYIFWINLFEAKFVLHVFFTGFLMMVLLMPNGEEQSKQLEKAI